jgi:glycosyltransferase involved in cell wall biosynthesis
MRSNSLSHVKKSENFLEWHSHVKNISLRPFGSQGGKNIPSYNPTLISVVVPVGPGHEIYLQDCLDSLMNQSFTAWEVILINDTGMQWLDDQENVINPYLQGFPFAKIVDSYGDPHGPAWARNVGIAEASADKIVFLDADDYAQPIFLEALYKIHQEVGGYCYSDWYADNGQEIYHDKAHTFRPDVLLSHAVGPISGIFNKEDLELIGRFDEQIQGWEDWDLHLSLLEHCICGTRIMEPLITYRYRTGQNRDKDFDNKDVLLKYITSKHTKLYGEGSYMGCSSCGGSATFTPKTITPSTAKMDGEDVVKIMYVGPETQTRTVKSQFKRGHSYRFGKDEAFYVYAKEKDRFLAVKGFVEVPEEPATEAIEYSPVTVKTTVEKPTYLALKDLGLDPEITGILERASYMTAEQASLASDASLLRIRGMGDARLKKVREALKKNGY